MTEQMVEIDQRLKPPEEFAFPFPPYDIQEQFMLALFETLNNGQLGIFESPTGTGKSLSLICGALTWFIEYHKQRKLKLQDFVKEEKKDEEDEDDWFAAAAARQQHNQKRLLAKQELDRINNRQSKIDKIIERRKSMKIQEDEQNIDEFNKLFKEVQWMKKAIDKELTQGGGGDDDILLDDYHSDGEEDQLEEEEEPDTKLKIIFCSRTHSQLTQFVREVKKSPFGSEISLVSLASRGVMCINPAVKSLHSQNAINERCRELGKHKAKPTKIDTDANTVKKSKQTKSGGCPYNKPKGIENLRDDAILGVHDIEDLVEAGKKTDSCPYYASRSAVPLCEMIVLPYNTLLHSATRKAIGINLMNSVVIIDEAHNLLETISGIHSVTVMGSQLCSAYSQLSQYKLKYKMRLKASNLLYIKQILFVLASFIKYLGGVPGKEPHQQTTYSREETKLIEVSEFLSETETYNQNLLKLVKYCNISQIAHKLQGFSEKYPGSEQSIPSQPQKRGVGAFLQNLHTNKSGKVVQQTPDPPSVKSNSAATTPAADQENTRPGSAPLMGVVEFLSTLATNFGDSRVVIKRANTLAGGSIRFLLLDPASQFKEIVRDAHSVIVAGGTMSPIEEFKQQLFVASGADPSRITHFSCDHVVPGEHLAPLVLGSGPTGVQLDFSYQHRDSPKVLDELGRVLQNVVAVIPAGIVVFVPSYDYEERIFTHLQAAGFMSKISQKKSVFREPRKSHDSDKILQDYSRAVRMGKDGNKGAILFAVVGGKMSEGINFSDDLGRCVVMVGMPYPNLHSPELKEKMAYLNTNVGSVGGRMAGQVHYENLCMKAVNQSVGRAIRHKQDYASILFLDHRYSRPSVQEQLPSWINKHVRIESKFGPVVAHLRKFFKTRQATESS